VSPVDQRLPVKWGRWFTFSTDKKTLYALFQSVRAISTNSSPL
jgi:hypothetical protein